MLLELISLLLIKLNCNIDSVATTFDCMKVLDYAEIISSPYGRNVNGPDTPRPLNRPKLSLSTSLATNGLPDSTDDKEPLTEQEENVVR